MPDIFVSILPEFPYNFLPGFPNISEDGGSDDVWRLRNLGF